MKKLILALCALAVLLALPGIAVAGPNGDSDRDGVDNRNEHREGTDPHRRDSDRDGRADGREDADRDGLDNATEDATGNDPVDRDSDDDGIRDDHEGAGTVSAFADGTLTIRLADGATVSGTVDDVTDLSCPTESSYEHGQVGRGFSKAYRRGSRRSRRGHRSAARAHRSSVPDDEEGWDGDEEGDDPTGDEGDEDWADDDGSEEDDGASDEDSEDGESAEATGPCVARLTRGAVVHGSMLDSGEDGSYVLAVELVR